MVDPRLVRLAGLADDVRAVADGPPPGRSADLAAVLSGRDVHRDEDLSPGAGRATSIARRCLPHAGGARPGRRGDAGLLRRIGAMGMVAKVGIGLGLVGAGAVAAGAGGVLPDPATSAIRDAIEAVTPFDLPDAGASGISDADDTGEPSNRTADDGPAGAASADAESVTGDVASRQDAGLTDPRAAAREQAGRPADDVSASGSATRASGAGARRSTGALRPAEASPGRSSTTMQRDPHPARAAAVTRSRGRLPVTRATPRAVDLPPLSRRPFRPRHMVCRGRLPGQDPRRARARHHTMDRPPTPPARPRPRIGRPHRSSPEHPGRHHEHRGTAPSGGPPGGAPAGNRPGPAPGGAAPPAQPPGAGPPR